MSSDIDVTELLAGVGPSFLDIDPYKLTDFINGIHHRLEALEAMHDLPHPADRALKPLCTHENYSCVKERQEAVPAGELEAFKRGREALDEKVEALVKAVLEACDYLLPEAVMALLTKAVEPFETKS